MKIKRIKEIINVGTYKNFITGGDKQFEELTLIYGLNTYGKTTLIDIFQSLKDNKPSLINDRKTIPNVNEDQKITLSVGEKNGREEKISFQNSMWNKSNFSDKIEIFGENFIDINVFTHSIIERDNKENFTDFILGESGVRNVKEIEEKKKELRGNKSDLKNVVPLFVKGKSTKEIDDFINYSVEEFDFEDIKKQLIDEETKLQEEEKRLKNPQKIIDMPQPNELEIKKINILDNIKKINFVLRKDYSNIKDKTLKKLNDHINANFSDSSGAEQWIQKGLKYTKDDNCPYCGQNLQNAKDLIDVYDKFFDKSYNEFINTISSTLEDNIVNVEKMHFDYTKDLQEKLLKVKDYIPLIKDNNFKDKANDFEIIKNNLNESKLEEEKNKITEDLKEKIDAKNKIPYKKVTIYNFEEFEKSINSYIAKLEEAKAIIKETIKIIENFKNEYKNVTKSSKIDKLKATIEKLKYKKAKFEQDNDCKKYRVLENEINGLEKEIPSLEKQLNKEQSGYLEKYFKKINYFFKKLGSNDFVLKQEMSRQGNKPVYSLKVKFKGQVISNENLRTVFSSSDRRALALSIFWAKINLEEKDIKRRTIVILDDPITSFDENRITNTINLLSGSLNNFHQMIITTHYHSFLRRFYEINKDNKSGVKLLEIKKNNETSYIDNGEKDKFILNEYGFAFNEIYDFTNGKNQNDIRTKLRLFLENYLKETPKKQIRDSSIKPDSLGDLIEKLFDKQIIGEKEKIKLLEFKDSLNPDSHIFTINNIEDVRSFAKEMMEFLYSIQFKQSEVTA
jgi:wobble nucleotide-excising tRNase